MSKAMRTRSARERLAQERKQQAAKDQRIRGLLISGAAVVVIALVVAGVVVFQSKGDKKNTAGAYTGPVAPSKVEQDGTVVMAQANAAGPSVEVYEDFQCPICKEFESSSGDVIKRLAGQGKIKLSYRILAFVNPQGSARAAVAAKCAADVGRFTQFHDVAFKNQPNEREALTIGKLKEWGKEAGITGGSYDGCVSGQQFASQVKKNTDTGLAVLQQKFGGNAGTPSMLVNGKAIDQNTMFDRAALERTILAASPVPSSLATPGS